MDTEYRNMTLGGVRARGRGAATLNPANRFDDIHLYVLGEHRDAELVEHPTGIQIQTHAIHDETRKIINRVSDSPDIGFDWTVNPYRGCEHGCIYCYARPTHEYLGMSCGLDFETKIMVKHDAAKLFRRELASPKWKGDPIVFSGVTDCYQPLEAKLRITRSLLEICVDCSQPMSIVTKNRLVTRDIDLLRKLAKINATRVAVSLTTLDANLAQAMEPRTSTPRDRLRAIRELTDAGIPAVVMAAPIIPGLNDREIPAILKAAAEAGAVGAGWTMLRLPWQIKELFLDWLHRNVPEKAARVEHLIREVRGGKLYNAQFGKRMRGEGEHAKLISRMMKTYKKRYGLTEKLPPMSRDHFRRPLTDGQLMLLSV